MEKHISLHTFLYHKQKWPIICLFEMNFVALMEQMNEIKKLIRLMEATINDHFWHFDILYIYIFDDRPFFPSIFFHVNTIFGNWYSQSTWFHFLPKAYTLQTETKTERRTNINVRTYKIRLKRCIKQICSSMWKNCTQRPLENFECNWKR